MYPDSIIVSSPVLGWRSGSCECCTESQQNPIDAISPCLIESVVTNVGLEGMLSKLSISPKIFEASGIGGLDIVGGQCKSKHSKRTFYTPTAS